ncbi:siphovirus Gp157 family protein [Serratia rubidaea]|uniref:siphovirus Gp157 family protein n=1 Tax=Serratia rubidaea TaxID=61652 RepID=UPI001F269F74|nr:siphovirus Gp157 family protein [Serratia rubidaea]UJD80080.1 siphovirus Gp157 family protein [Serratia rubidaea]UJD84636.1 siphovirus Gp157 family protein [Serratia rubidaea]HDJ1439746.1 siphovirus Gp157 family protein [Serratia rubidaea]HDJ1447228.1 siphovirus Gp157 family protein [Serratia rubidaea]HDJ1463790.1 siphovirus Gp157 family protein [Serratia rubidaea]
MSITAIALASDYAKLQQLVETSDELTPEMIADTLEGIEGALGDKLDAAFVHVRNLEGLAKTVDGELKRLADRKKSFESRAKSIREYVLNCLLASGQDKIKTTTNTFTARKGGASVVIDNADLLPDELVTVQTLVTPDKKAIKVAIDSGEDVKGAHIEIGERSLQVR